MNKFSQVSYYVRGPVPPGLRDQVIWCEVCHDTVERVTICDWVKQRTWRGTPIHQGIERTAVTVECHGRRLRFEDPVDILRIMAQVMYGGT